jgi:hypothetical protein
MLYYLEIRLRCEHAWDRGDADGSVSGQLSFYSLAARAGPFGRIRSAALVHGCLPGEALCSSPARMLLVLIRLGSLTWVNSTLYP